MIYVVEDDKSIRNLVSYALTEKGYDVKSFEDGRSIAQEIRENSCELLLLDLMLPGKDGVTILKEIREFSDLPVIILTAKTDEFDKVMGLESGADDYITKPFNLLELIARVKSNLRRYVTLGTYNNEKLGNNEVLISGGLELNTSTKEVKVDGQIVRVTPIEFKILNLLIANKGRVFSIDEIYEKVWNEESFNVENTVAVHIRRIRGKIEINPKEPRYLKVVWGVGYKIEKL